MIHCRIRLLSESGGSNQHETCTHSCERWTGPVIIKLHLDEHRIVNVGLSNVRRAEQ